MSRLIDIDNAGRMLSIAFPYDREILDVVRALPQRRFNRDDKSWYVPAQHVEEVIGTLCPLSFELSEEVRAFCEAADKDVETILAKARQTHRPVIDLEKLPEGTWTIASLNEETRTVLHEAFRESVWVAAEIQGFDRNKRRGHAFFELVHRPFVRSDPTAKVAAVLWQQEREAIEDALRLDGGNVRLRDGLIVRMLVKVDFYTGQGRYQVNVQDIDLAYTDGTLQQNRERVLRLLEQEQLADINLMRTWPLCPLRIGLITSYESDAYMDFVHELQQSGFGFQVYVHHVQVQGANTQASVLKALDYFAHHAEHFDALAIVRGGGARTDLAYFDTEPIGRAVCQHPLKIVVGVGHQRDICLLDFIAYSEKTPTAAAQFFVDRIRLVAQTFEAHQTHLIELAEDLLETRRAQLQRLGHDTQSQVRLIVEHEHRTLERVAYRIQLGAQADLDRSRRQLEHVSSAIPAATRGQLQLARARTDNQARRLEPQRIERPLTRQLEQLNRAQQRIARATEQVSKREQRRLEHIQTRLNLLDPRRILERGFALIRQGDTLIKDARQVQDEEPLHIQLAHGQLTARLTDRQEEE